MGFFLCKKYDDFYFRTSNNSHISRTFPEINVVFCYIWADKHLNSTFLYLKIIGLQMDFKWIVHYETLTFGQTITASLYCVIICWINCTIKYKKTEIDNKRQLVLQYESWELEGFISSTIFFKYCSS